MRDERRVKAIHEAGHAVIAWLCGFDTDFVNIKPEEERLGGVLLNLTSAQEQSFDANDLDMVRRRILVTCGGVIADMKHAAAAGEPPDNELYGWGSDINKASEFMLKLREWGNIQLNKYKVLVTYLFQVEDNWNMAVQVADILVLQDELTVNEIQNFRAQCAMLSPEVIALSAAT